MVSRKLAMRHEPDIGLRCRSTCSKITSFYDEKHEMTTTPSPHPCTPCVGPKRLRVCRHPAHMCFNMCAWCWHTRGRFECTHGDVLIVSRHTTPHTQHNTTQHNTRRQRKKTETERRQDEEREKRPDKTKRGRKEKTRRREGEETRQDEEIREKRQDKTKRWRRKPHGQDSPEHFIHIRFFFLN